MGMGRRWEGDVRGLGGGWEGGLQGGKGVCQGGGRGQSYGYRLIILRDSFIIHPTSHAPPIPLPPPPRPLPEMDGMGLGQRISEN